MGIREWLDHGRSHDYTPDYWHWSVLDLCIASDELGKKHAGPRLIIDVFLPVQFYHLLLLSSAFQVPQGKEGDQNNKPEPGEEYEAQSNGKNVHAEVNRMPDVFERSTGGNLFRFYYLYRRWEKQNELDD